jgi:hypothetical protein
MVKRRLLDPSEFSAFDLQGKFRRFEICSTSTTIDINRSIFSIRHQAPLSVQGRKKTVSATPLRLS